VWIVTLPFSPDASDLPLRPAFLSLLDAWTTAAREHAAPRRSEVGTAWKLPGAHDVAVEGPGGAVSVGRDDGVARVAPPLVGVYRITVDGKTETRVAAPDARELDLRPRAAGGSAGGEGMGEHRASVDVSGPIALVLLALVAAEMALRTWSRRKTEAV
jgi:hypothetical protein